MIASSGSVDGQEVVQLYVQFLEKADQPLCQLRGFGFIFISADAQETVAFPLKRRYLSCLSGMSLSKSGLLLQARITSLLVTQLEVSDSLVRLR